MFCVCFSFLEFASFAVFAAVTQPVVLAEAASTTGSTHGLPLLVHTNCAAATWLALRLGSAVFAFG